MRLLNDIRRFDALSPRRKLFLLSFLTALSGVLSVLDSSIPKPIPFMKFGLANLVTLILVLEKRYALAMETAFLRTLVSAMVLGTLFSLPHLLSFSGAICAVLFSIALFHFSEKRISSVGLSVWGALFSSLAQIAVVGIFFGFDRGLALMAGTFILIGSATGVVNGFLARWFYRNADF